MPDFVDFSLISKRCKVRRRVHDVFAFGEAVSIGGVCVHEWRGWVRYGRRHFQVKAFAPFGVRPIHWLAVVAGQPSVAGALAV